MKVSKYRFSRIDLTPLLDVVFIFLFITVVALSRYYNDSVTKERERFQRTQQEMQQTLQQLRTENVNLTLQQTKRLTQMQQLLAEREEKISLLESQLNEIKAKSVQQLDKIKTELENTQQSKEKDAKRVSTQLVSAQQELRVKLAENNELLTQKLALESELQLAKQHIENDLAPVRQLQTNQQLSPIITVLKAGFVDEVINTYLITIKPINPEKTQDGNKITLKTRSGQERSIVIYEQNKEQLGDFLDENIPHQSKDKIFIIFLRNEKSSVEYAKWVKDYLKENQFYFKESLAETS